jgi:membrane-bound serine protease (ClpP class)
VPSLIGFASFFILCTWLVIRSQRRPVSTGLAALVGERGRAVDAIAGGGQGKIVFHGEMWTAQSELPVAAGQSVEVIAIERRVARIRPLSDHS